MVILKSPVKPDLSSRGNFATRDLVERRPKPLKAVTDFVWLSWCPPRQTRALHKIGLGFSSLKKRWLTGRFWQPTLASS